nr:unnamed protein product [Spirometra erinaceieuropaei]
MSMLQVFAGLALCALLVCSQQPRVETEDLDLDDVAEMQLLMEILGKASTTPSVDRLESPTPMPAGGIGSQACGARDKTTESPPGRQTPDAPYKSGPKAINCPGCQPMHGGKRSLTDEEIAAPEFRSVVNRSLIDLKNQTGGCIEYDLVEVKEATKQTVTGTKYEWKMTVRPRPIPSAIGCPVSDCEGIVDGCQTHREYISTAWATTIFAADEDIQEGQLIVFLLLLHRKLNVREDGVELFFESQHLIPFDDDEGFIHIPSREFRSVVSENQRLQPLKDRLGYESRLGYDNRVSRELLESWFSGPQSINKHNDLPVPYFVLRFCLGRRISHVRRARVSNYHGNSEPVCRAIVTPASGTDDEIAAINDSDSDRQATAASITTPAAIARTVNCSAHTVPRQPRAINTALLVPPSPLSANVSDDGFE